MPRTIAPATPQDVLEVQSALVSLKAARDCLTRASAPSALGKVHSAIKSTEGALRHVQHRLRRSDADGARLAAGDFSGPARAAGYGVWRADWNETGGESWGVTTPTRGNLPDYYATEAEGWAAALKDLRSASPIGADLAEACEGFTCNACGRPEADCSADPCADVLEDRES